MPRLAHRRGGGGDDAWPRAGRGAAPRLAGHGNGWVGAAAVGATTLVTALFILNTALRPDPWYDPRYVIALVGIVLGSVLNAASLALDGMLAGASREKLAIEARISLGAPPRLAFATVLRESVRRGILPASTRCRRRASSRCPAS